MAMSMGMMGALGGMGNGTGLGGALTHEAGVMLKREEDERALAGKTKFEQWLLAAREEFQIKAEGRADKRTIEAEGRARAGKREDDEYAFGKRLERAPQEREMKVEDGKATAKGALEFETQNIDQITGNAQRKTEAGRTEAQKKEDEARADYYRAVADDVATNGKGGKKIDPMVKAQIDALDDEIKGKQGVIDKARSEAGGWDPAKNPGQKALETELAAMRLQRRGLWGSATRPAEGAPDPLRLRQPAAKPDPLGLDAKAPAAPSAPAARQPGETPEAFSQRSMIQARGTDVAGQLEIMQAELDDPARSEADKAAIRREMARLGGGPGVVKEPPPASAAPADTGMMGPPRALMSPNASGIRDAPPGSVELRDGRFQAPGNKATPPGTVDLARGVQAEDGTDPAMEVRRDQESREINDFKRSDFSPEVKDYRTKVKSLRAKLEEQRRREFAQREQQRARTFSGI